VAARLISFGAHAMDHIPGEEMPAVGKAAHAVVQEAVDAGVWVFGAGLENQRASIVATDRTVTSGPFPEAIGGFAIVDVPSREEALAWAAKIALACRCAQEVRELMPDPEQDAMLRPADRPQLRDSQARRGEYARVQSWTTQRTDRPGWCLLADDRRGAVSRAEQWECVRVKTAWGNGAAAPERRPACVLGEAVRASARRVPPPPGSARPGRR
jgi:hypothetical protein